MVPVALVTHLVNVLSALRLSLPAETTPAPSKRVRSATLPINARARVRRFGSLTAVMVRTGSIPDLLAASAGRVRRWLDTVKTTKLGDRASILPVEAVRLYRMD